MRRFKRILSCGILCLAVLLLFSSCSAPEAKEFSKSGMHITLTDAFREGKYYNMTAYYDWEEEDVVVSAIKEEFAVLEGAGESASLSLEEYAKGFLEDNQITADVKTENGLTYFTFEKTPYDVVYVYYAFAYKSSDAYWLFQFVCQKENQGAYAERFMEWAASVRFD